MTIKQTIAVSALALGICMAAPAYAQQASNSQAGAIGLVATAINTSTDTNMQDSNNDNSDNRIRVSDSQNDNSDSSNNSTNDSLNTDVAISDSGNDSRDQSDSSNNSTNDSLNTDTSLMFALGSFNSDSSNNSTNDSNNGNDSSSIVANQTLSATSSTSPILFLSLVSDNSSGDNSVAGSAFAAYSGILNAAWNTGISSNAQAGTNTAARGTVSFGD